MERINCLVLVEDLNNISEEIERIFDRYKGKELTEIDSKRVDALETKAHMIKKGFEKSDLFEVFQLYYSSLKDMEYLAEKMEKYSASFNCVLENRIEQAERDYRNAKAILSSKSIWVEI